MEKDTLNQDKNLGGRVGAALIIVAAVLALGRVCGMNAGTCPIGGMCPFMSAHGMTQPAAEAPSAPAQPLKQ